MSSTLFITMEPPRTPERPSTPRYMVSPATIALIERKYRECCTTPPRKSPAKPPVGEKIVEIGPSLNSPEVEAYLAFRHLQLFGVSPVPDLISPLRPTPEPLKKDAVASTSNQGREPLRPSLSAPGSSSINPQLDIRPLPSSLPSSTNSQPGPWRRYVDGPPRKSRCGKQRGRTVKVRVDGNLVSMSRRDAIAFYATKNAENAKT